MKDRRFWCGVRVPRSFLRMLEAIGSSGSWRTDRLRGNRCRGGRGSARPGGWLAVLWVCLRLEGACRHC
jgi:hypothetical protein